MNKSSYETTPSPNNVALATSVGSGSVSNQGVRRSVRLSFKKRIKVASSESDEEASEHYGNERKRTKTVESQPPPGLNFEVSSNESVLREVLVDDENMVSDARNDANGTVNAPGLNVEVLSNESVLKEVLVDYENMESDARNDVNGTVNATGLNVEVLSNESVLKEVLVDYENMESDARNDVNGIVNAPGLNVEVLSNESVFKEVLVDYENMEIDARNDVNGTVNVDRSRFTVEEGKLEVEVIDLPGLNVEVLRNEVVHEEVLVDNEIMEIDSRNDVNGTVNVDQSRFPVEEGKLEVEVIDLQGLSESDSEMDSSDSDLDSDVIPRQGFFWGRTIHATDAERMEQIRRRAIPATDAERMEQTRRRREIFKRTARRSASKFAYFSVEMDEDGNVAKDRREANDVIKDADWTGPFSTALKIVRDRARNMSRQKTATLNKNKSVPLWVPKENKERKLMKKVAPSLQDLCLEILVENADALTSLESVPDELRHKLSHLLCKSRKMNSHFLDLLASGSPSEIRVRDSSWLNEEPLTKTLEKADTSNLTVLQLDQCGRCVPDYVLLTTLTKSPSKFSALTNISLKGACRLSNAGLDTLVSSTPALRSINLGCCSLLTSDGIITLADKLGPILKELYIDECIGIVDAKSILPALLKIQHLEVLSISHFETVDDSFVIEFVTAQGQKMKELIFADCTKLTDRAVKAIADNCPELCVIDLTNLRKLTDNALGHLANGCQSIQTMKFQRNAFSDKFVAAYIEASGKHLRELSLNHVAKVGNQTAISLAKHARNLQNLDLSWCREVTDEALGLIVDSCLSLKILKLFGCTQITEIFKNGHSNEQVNLIGLKESFILKNIEVPDFLPLKYSAA